MVRPTLSIKVVLCLGVCLLCASLPIFAADWPPISQEELAMKDNPASPGALAMVLYREQVADATESTETLYYRYKIFTEEGKKYANVEIPLIAEPETVDELPGDLLAAAKALCASMKTLNITLDD